MRFEKAADVQDVNDILSDYTSKNWRGPVNNHPMLNEYLALLDAERRQDFDASDPEQVEEFLGWVDYELNSPDPDPDTYNDGWDAGYYAGFMDAVEDGVAAPAALRTPTQPVTITISSNKDYFDRVIQRGSAWAPEKRYTCVGCGKGFSKKSDGAQDAEGRWSCHQCGTRLGSRHVEGSWAEVRAKAQRLRSSGSISIELQTKQAVHAIVEGDSGTYETSVSRIGGAGLGVSQVSGWSCSCQWGEHAWDRVSFIGRMCSHALAVYYDMQKKDR